MAPWFLRNVARGAARIESSATTLAPTAAEHLLSDEPGLRWRTEAGAAWFVLDLGVSQPVDAVALYWTNLRSFDTVRWRAADSLIDLTGGALYDSGLQPAFAGSLYTPKATKHVFPLPSRRVARYWRCDIDAAGLPFVEVGRVLMGRTISLAPDMDMEATQLVSDPSIIDSGTGWEDIDERPRGIGWRCAFSWIPNTIWRQQWFPFLQEVGQSVPVLFVPQPDDLTSYQETVVYGRLQRTEGQHPIYDGWTMQIELTERGS